MSRLAHEPNTAVQQQGPWYITVGWNGEPFLPPQGPAHAPPSPRSLQIADSATLLHLLGPRIYLVEPCGTVTNGVTSHVRFLADTGWNSDTQAKFAADCVRRAPEGLRVFAAAAADNIVQGADSASAFHRYWTDLLLLVCGEDSEEWQWATQRLLQYVHGSVTV